MNALEFPIEMPPEWWKKHTATRRTRCPACGGREWIFWEVDDTASVALSMGWDVAMLLESDDVAIALKPQSEFRMRVNSLCDNASDPYFDWDGVDECASCGATV